MQMSGSKHPLLFGFRELSHSYSNKGPRALNGINLDIPYGSIYGLIGPDGGGKSTFIKIACNILRMQSGQMFYSGQQLPRGGGLPKGIYGYVPEVAIYYPKLTVDEHLDIICKLRGIDKNASLENLGQLYSHLHPYRHLRAVELSGGMRQKLSLCCAMVSQPDVLFLDEPTTGMDIMSKRELWTLLKASNRAGVTIVVATSEMDEAANCTDISLIYHGVIIEQGTPASLISNFNEQLYLVSCDDPRKIHMLLAALREQLGSDRCYLRGRDIILRTLANTPIDRLRELVASQSPDTVFKGGVSPMIEDIFIKHIHGKHIEHREP